MSFKIPFLHQLINPSQFIELIAPLFQRWSGTELVLFQTLDLGVWNMNTTLSLDVSTPRNLSYKRIIGNFLTIYDDTGKPWDGSFGDGIASISPDTASAMTTITQKAGGFFNNTSFQSTAATRGSLILCYTT